VSEQAHLLNAELTSKILKLIDKPINRKKFARALSARATTPCLIVGDNRHAI
jgi:hypothetical protein